MVKLDWVCNGAHLLSKIVRGRLEGITISLGAESTARLSAGEKKKAKRILACQLSNEGFRSND
jgi:hypothetical protein